MIKVVVDGFKTIEEANEFCEWYSGQGEQDAAIWFDCRKSEGIIACDTMDCSDIQKVSDQQINMTVKPV